MKAVDKSKLEELVKASEAKNEGDYTAETWAVFKNVLSEAKYNLQGTTQGNGLTGGVPPVRFSMQCSSCRLWRLRW